MSSTRFIARSIFIHFVGDEITWPDLIVYSLLDNLLEIDNQENLLNKYSKLKKNRVEISQKPNIANYLKSRSQNSSVSFIIVLSDTIEMMSEFTVNNIFLK
jgi:hypothetical protein